MYLAEAFANHRMKDPPGADLSVAAPRDAARHEVVQVRAVAWPSNAHDDLLAAGKAVPLERPARVEQAPIAGAQHAAASALFEVTRIADLLDQDQRTGCQRGVPAQCSLKPVWRDRLVMSTLGIGGAAGMLVFPALSDRWGARN